MGDSIDFMPSTLEVDYDKNLTALYKSITDQNWETAVSVCKKDPEQAKTWVVRRYEEEEDDDTADDIMWRFLPLHSACARQPPMSVVASLLRAYPDGAKCQDDQGMYALHYACGNQAARDVVRILLVSYPEAAKKRDPRGMLPIHYLACWGPSSVSVVDMLLVANPDVSSTKDAEGKTPLDMAREGDYPEKSSVIAVLQKWFSTASSLTKGHDDASLTTNISRRPVKTSESMTSTKNSSARSRRSKESPTAAAPTSTSQKSRRFINSNRYTEGEEKKDEYDSHVVPDSPRGFSLKMPEVTQFKEEIEILKTEKAAMENKLVESERNNGQQEEELYLLRQQLAEIKVSRSRGDLDKEETERELEKTRVKLSGCTGELKGLRLTMVDMMEEHDELKKVSDGMNGRLGSLSVNLSGLMSQQKDLAKIIRSSAEKRKTSYELRKENMRALLEMEEEHQQEDEALESKLKKQSREMEALSAMIEAARD
mmetsp:Transcript_12411/g.16306  ORF Transcript_12411/g.16306 Transcript_12411/m.16306 type:complete len:483 (-) Transcript_12411:174-1622(-)|eukprot:CAMPEP_0198144812 /NCGR_PEP_ID=MMETSP1443-20131203/18687_1 /TAXON_ID=186043 /ORGANISM="Entomoneis sp., Strain CCMP2396" /LENGTH=482 /DNA_ID=CAMNT_0043808275 /DNA_START=87 /DNA_END=1535 /DNA_ORIENTATION=+